MIAFDCVLEQNILDDCLVCQAVSRMYICHIYLYIYISIQIIHTFRYSNPPNRQKVQ